MREYMRGNNRMLVALVLLNTAQRHAMLPRYFKNVDLGASLSFILAQVLNVSFPHHIIAA